MTDRLDLVPTRRSLHAVAEQILAAARYAAEQRIGLQATPGGFGTPPFASAESGPREIAVRGTDLVVRDDTGERSGPITTLRAAGKLGGVTPGAPPLYEALTADLDLDAPLVVDPSAAACLADWYALVEQTLVQFTADHPDGTVSGITLWPEHFDLALQVDRGDGEVIDIGGSPGDADHARPYLYVAPWNRRSGAFWNEPWGASLDLDRAPSLDAAAAFLREADGLLLGSV